LSSKTVLKIEDEDPIPGEKTAESTDSVSVDEKLSKNGSHLSKTTNAQLTHTDFHVPHAE